MSKNDSKKDKRWWGPAVGMDYSSHQQIEEQATEVEQYCDYVDSTSQPGSYSRHHGPPRTMPTRAASAQRPTMNAYHRILLTYSRALATSPIVR